jgi:hypothetical protein
MARNIRCGLFVILLTGYIGYCFNLQFWIGGFMAKEDDTLITVGQVTNAVLIGFVVACCIMWFWY